MEQTEAENKEEQTHKPTKQGIGEAQLIANSEVEWSPERADLLKVSENSPNQMPLINIQVQGLPDAPKPRDQFYKAPCLFKNQAVDPGTLRITDYKKFMTMDSINTYNGYEESERDDQMSPAELDGASPKVMRPMMNNMRQSITIHTDGSDALMDGKQVVGIMRDSQQRPSLEQRNGLSEKKRGVMPLNLEKVLNANKVERSLNLTQQPSSRRKQELNAPSPPPISTRRINQQMQSPQQIEIEARKRELSTSQEMQPIFQAMWKVILTLCYQRDALREYMRKSNLIAVPIRALHYQEIICLFRKAHGPILEVKKKENSQQLLRNSFQQKKASLVKAADTVQGFIHYSIFCKDFVQMIGDAVLLVKPKIYYLIVQLLFEACTIRHVTAADEDIIYMRRITDIISPFENTLTDPLPVHKLFNIQTLETIVKYFCLIETKEKEQKRLIERHFIPQALMTKQAGQEQLHDNIEKVMQHYQWKENRGDSILTNSFKQDGNEPSALSKQLKRIVHGSKLSGVVNFPTPQLLTELEIREKNGSEVSDPEAQNDLHNFNSLQPKLPVSQTPQTAEQSPLCRSPLGDNPNQPIIDSVNPSIIKADATHFHVKVQPTSMPRTPEQNARRKKTGTTNPYEASGIAHSSTKTHTDQTVDLSHAAEQFSFQGSKRPVTNEIYQRRAGSRPPAIVESQRQEGEGKFSKDKRIEVTGQLGEYLDRPLSKLDVMQFNTKYQRLNLKNKTLADAKILTELKQFAHHKALFEKMFVAGKANQGESEKGSEQHAFNVQINSKGKLDEFEDDTHEDMVHPIDEHGEFSDDNGSSIQHQDTLKAVQAGNTLTSTLLLDKNKQELFDFKSLFNRKTQRFVPNLCDTAEQITLDSPLSSVTKPSFNFQEEDRQVDEEIKEVHSKNHDYNNKTRVFNRQNLQQQSRKNKKLIAKDVKQFHEQREIRGFNACLQTGQRYRSHQQAAPVKKPKQPSKSTPRNLAILKEPKFTDMMRYNLSPPNTIGTNGVALLNTRASSFQASFKEQSNHGNFTPINRTTTLDSSCITNLQINTTGTQVVSSKGGPRPLGQIRRPSRDPRLHIALWSPVSSTNRANMRAMLGSPESGRSQVTKNETAGASSNHTRGVDEASLEDAINCRTIPTQLVKDVKARTMSKNIGTSPLGSDGLEGGKKQIQVQLTSIAENMKNAIPIHFHLQDQSKLCDEFSPFSMNIQGEQLKDSLHAMSRKSENQNHQTYLPTENGRTTEDDGICTMRADSTLDAVNLIHRLDPKKTTNTTTRNSIYANTSNQARSNNQQLHPGKAESSLTQPTKIVLVAPKQNINERSKVRQVVTKKPTTQTGLVDQSISQAKQVVFPMHKQTRVISTADNQTSRNKAHKLRNVDANGKENDSFGDIADGQVKISHLLGVHQRHDENSGVVKDRSGPQVDLNEIDRWHDSLESPGLILTKSDAQALRKQSHDNDELSQGEFTRTKPRDALELEHQFSSQKPQTSHPDMNPRTILKPEGQVVARQQLRNFDEFIAPRRSITRKQRIKNKAPLNMLTMHDFKATKNLKINMINPDLITSSRIETETVNLSHSVRTPDKFRRPARSVHDPRMGAHGYMTYRQPSPVPNGGRQPTPIKIVDLSANPGPVRMASTINQDYAKHISLFNNRQQPLLQEIATKIGRGKRVDSYNDASVNLATSLKSNRIMPTSNGLQKQVKRADNKQFSKDGTTMGLHGDFDLKSKVAYLVRSPLTSPKNYTQDGTTPVIPAITHRQNHNVSKSNHH